MNDFAVAEWERDHLVLASARQLVTTDPESAASRAYYAAFHALSALFALRGVTFRKHAGIRAALYRELVRAGLIDKQTGKDFDLLIDLRETGDYGGVARVPPESARLAVEKAEAFLAAIGRLAPGLAGGGESPQGPQ
jgi:hypothetical protein